jgi:hypothetical protein
MSTVSFTNQVASQALRGEDVIVSLDSTDTAKLSSISVGQQASISATSIYGVVSEIDSYGHSFQVTPIQPNFAFASPSQAGYLKATETVVVSSVPYLP